MFACRSLSPLAASALLVLIGAVAMAQSQSPLPPPVDRTQSTEARKREQNAKLEVTRAKGALDQLTTKMKNDFEAGDDWQKASAALKSAQAEYDALRKPLVEAMKKRPDYVKAEQDKVKAEQEIADLRSSGTFGDPMIKAATKRAEANSALGKIETDAFNAEPKFVEARKKLAEATTQVASLKKQFETAMAGDKDYQEAKKAVDTAQEQQTLAGKELAAAIKQEAEMEKARQEQIRQSRKRI